MASQSERSDLEKRVNHLEELFSHQEHLVHQLNDILANLQASFRQLEQRCAVQEDRLRWINENQTAGEDLPHEKPPHY